MSYDLRDRITRAEERLVAERSVRKTRNDQLFKFISQVHEDLENQGEYMRDLNSTLQKLNTTLMRMGDKVDSQIDMVNFVQKGNQENRDRIQDINGSIRAIKWIWPIIMTLGGVILTLFVANIDLKIDQEIHTEEGQVEVVNQEGVEENE